MTTKTRTPEEIYAEIKELNAQDRAAAAEPDSAPYWREAAARADQKRDLWRTLGDACDDNVTPWARAAAYYTADGYSDRAEQYRQFARQTEALRKQAGA